MSTSQAATPAPTLATSDDPPERHPGQHTRNYQACVACRNRKVKCDLGPVDDPRDPPCLRCRREAKECFFSSTRRKRRITQENDEESKSDADLDDKQNTKKKIRSTYSQFGGPSRFSAESRMYAPITPGGNIGQARPLKRPTIAPNAGPYEIEEEQAINENTVAMLQQSVTFTDKDTFSTMHRIMEANADIRRRRTYSDPSAYWQDLTLGNAPCETPRREAFIRGAQSSRRSGPNESSTSLHTLPSLSGKAEPYLRWQESNFVRGGWFTASEAICFIDFFFDHMLPLTPITLPDYKDPVTHGRLIREEPMLTVTILTIATRYTAMQNPRTEARTMFIHQKLWGCLLKMINQLGIGDDGFNSYPAYNMISPISNNHCRRLRSMGAIESLLLLTEWQAQAIHFPSYHGFNIIADDDMSYISPPSARDMVRPGAGIEEIRALEIARRRAESWIYPLERSNRMSWQFIGTAINIAYELQMLNGGTMPESADPERAENIRRLLYVFSVQTSGRLCLPSPIAEEHWQRVFDNLKDAGRFVQKPPPPDEASETSEHDSTRHIQETIHHFWYLIADMFATGNKKLFQSTKHSIDIIQSGEYTKILEELDREHQEWRDDFTACSVIPDPMRLILDIEFYYMRIYCNNVAFQAVVDRCVNKSPRFGSKAIPTETMEKWMGNDRKYINKIIEDSQALLRTVDELGPTYLRHVPTRTLLRVMSVSTILVKTFTFGIDESTLSRCVRLLDGAANALDASAVDDLHFASSFAMQIKDMIARARSNLIKVGDKKKKSNDAKSRSLDSRSSSVAPPIRNGQNGSPNNTAERPTALQERVNSFADHRVSTHKPTPLQQVSQPPQSATQGSYLQNFYGPYDYNTGLSANFNFPIASSAGGFNQTYNLSTPRDISTQYAWGQQDPLVSIMPPPGFTPLNAQHNAPNNPNSADAQNDTSQVNNMTTGPQYTQPPPTTTGMVTSGSYWGGTLAENPWYGMDIANLSRRGPAPVYQSDNGPRIDNQDMFDVMTPNVSGAAPSDWPNLSDNQGF